MIEIAGTEYAFTDPLILLVAGGIALLLLILVLLVRSVKIGSNAAKMVGPIAQQMGQLNHAVQSLGQGQERLAGGLQSNAELQSASQAQILQTMEMRLASVQQQMQERLHENSVKAARSLSDMQEKLNQSVHGSTVKTTKSLTELQERLATIDKAQANIEKLSGDVLGLQDILSNKQTRGAFGEIQLNDIVSKALPSNAYSFQSTLSNGKRADCLIHLPNPPGPIVVDSKFPLEAYEALRNANTKAEAEQAARAMRVAVKTHINAISERYIIEGETADGALMFLPSEAVYAELHASFPEVVREGFEKRVWIVSPTTCMATLNTMRAILKDAQMREQAGAIRTELGKLFQDVERLGTRVSNLDRHFGQAAKDISEIKISADKAGRRARRLDNFDFEELAPDTENSTLAPPVAE
ncbi:DNA recombination protein RmuC [Halocynthiibacter sp. C4]|uniref:DNA recombination protein RmuC n=1 Tax=Halocynthiibacter sp. C4 TaxID=2992758 RepID=UPI00237BFA33|nr:DNA recombination protein RmuC [Halocynthiibacter sp. C4]MDE0591119.1 DNA recombination protein RmuC [Halocynthiibacter sp. C4]